MCQILHRSLSQLNTHSKFALPSSLECHFLCVYVCIYSFIQNVCTCMHSDDFTNTYIHTSMCINKHDQTLCFALKRWFIMCVCVRTHIQIY